MKTAVCTLYEKHYHYGVAALINSLDANNFKGTCYIGYRGELPFWGSESVQIEENQEIEDWLSIKKMEVSNDIQLIFIQLETSIHLANYKPFFMLDLFEEFQNIKELFYFDPDIVVCEKWEMFTSWAEYGVAMVHEIVFNDMPRTHPVRKKWINIISDLGYSVKNDLNSYLNSGFCGVHRENIIFLFLWKEIILYAFSSYKMPIDHFADNRNRFHPFCSLDQDAFCIAAMATDCPISEYGPEGMDFIFGGNVMSHAVGPKKPWKKKFIQSTIKGRPPTIPEKKYWIYADGIIKIYRRSYIKRKKIAIKLSSLIGRFYS